MSVPPAARRVPGLQGEDRSVPADLARRVSAGDGDGYTSAGSVPPTPSAESRCALAGSGIPTCQLQDSACQSGACCLDGHVAQVGASCGVQRNVECACTAGDLHNRGIDNACDGLSSTCPQDPAWVKPGPWELCLPCTSGCGTTAQGYLGCLPAGSTGGAGACGSACLLGTPCHGGTFCARGTCVPAGCQTCFSLGQACDSSVSSCTVFGCAANGGGPAPANPPAGPCARRA